MKQGNAIEVHDVTKSFKVYLDKGDTIKEKVIFSNRRRYENRQVLKGISFDVKKGEAIGLIGHNGCGKSTTLKLLTKIMYPDSGTIEMKGRVSSLIELGAGFHPDMSGRENIYINASIFGLSKKEIDARLDDIIAFSELEEFIDNPVRTYSSGMYMRLAFSVAINVDAEILLIDEILSVGDASFQAKCFNKLREIKAKGATIVIVSHSLNQVEEFCERSIWIDEGLIREEGLPREVHLDYMEFMSDYTMNRGKTKEQMAAERKAREKAKKAEEEAERKKRKEKKILERKKMVTEVNEAGVPLAQLVKEVDEEQDKYIQINDVILKNKSGEVKHFFTTGESVTVEFEYEVLKPEHENVSVEFVIVRNDGLECYETNTFREGIKNMNLQKKGTISIDIPHLNLITGEYYIELALRKTDAFPYVYKDKAFRFNMTSVERERGIAKIDHTWNFERAVIENG